MSTHPFLGPPSGPPPDPDPALVPVRPAGPVADALLLSACPNAEAVARLAEAVAQGLALVARILCGR